MAEYRLIANHAAFEKARAIIDETLEDFGVMEELRSHFKAGVLVHIESVAFKGDSSSSGFDMASEHYLISGTAEISFRVAHSPQGEPGHYLTYEFHFEAELDDESYPTVFDAAAPTNL